MRKLSSKGQLSLGDAPTVVLLVGLLFLVMATMAFIADKFGPSLLNENSGSGIAVNESVTTFKSGTPFVFAAEGLYRDTTCIITGCVNATGAASNAAGIAASNYTTSSSACSIVYSAAVGGLYNNTAGVRCSYTYTYTPLNVAFNATGDLQTEISNNTSIAGIVLTISLVGIVLTVLIGVFLGVRRTRI